jgi:NTP pyrophosphatase (non-canonical NTP hydrolase)
MVKKANVDMKAVACFLNMEAFECVLKAVRTEAIDATDKHGGFNSAHEAYGVLAEEVDEFWEEVRKKRRDRNIDAMQKELIQVAAVAVKYAAMLEAQIIARDA